MRHPERDWNRYYLSGDPSMTLEFIEQNIYSICFDQLLKNEFLYNKYVYKREKIRIFLKEK